MALRAIGGSLCLLLCIVGAVPGQTRIYLDPRDGEIYDCMHDYYCVEVWVDSVPNIGGYSVEVTYLPDEITLNTISEGTIFSSAGHGSFFLSDTTREEPEMTIHADGADQDGMVSGPGHLFTMCFVRPWLVGCTTPLSFARAVVWWGIDQAETLDVVTEDGTVTITNPTPVDAASWGRIKGLYR